MVRPEGVPAYTIRQLAAFVAVAEWGTITAAADALHMSHSALSAAISDLERALDVKLLVRQRARGVRLTPIGHAVLGRAETLLHFATELESDARSEAGSVAGPVAVGCYPSLGPTMLPALIAGFTRVHPRARVDFREDTQNRLRALLDSHDLDVAFLYDLDLEPGLESVVLDTREPMLLLPADHPRAQSGEPVPLTDLAREPMVMLDAPPSSGHAVAVCAEAGFSPVVAYRTQNYETCRAFVGRGLGWSLLLQRPAQDTTYEGRPIAVRPFAEPKPAPVDVLLAWRNDALRSRVAQTFVDFVVASRRAER
ncbi:MAG: LysR family transcriptional regulator [Rhodococcus sp.]|uniref:LysR family transcriptional regulator n=1 Tax=Rhodococcus TaxID=1827 RepID=UPI0016B542AC|nr:MULTISPECIES: LysR family transcriptional regulator [Rhodococcus]NLV80011.1 LysR family transcriptional regulator [Rhodococcus sp. (in: high G+C Gram-positive bacteria)]